MRTNGKNKKMLRKSSAKTEKSATCICEKSPDDKLYYCYKTVGGTKLECSGPYQSKQECIDATGGKCR